MFYLKLLAVYSDFHSYLGFPPFTLLCFSEFLKYTWMVPVFNPDFTHKGFLKCDAEKLQFCFKTLINHVLSGLKQKVYHVLNTDFTCNVSAKKWILFPHFSPHSILFSNIFFSYFSEFYQQFCLGLSQIFSKFVPGFPVNYPGFVCRLSWFYQDMPDLSKCFTLGVVCSEKCLVPSSYIASNRFSEALDLQLSTRMSLCVEKQSQQATGFGQKGDEIRRKKNVGHGGRGRGVSGCSDLLPLFK